MFGDTLELVYGGVATTLNKINQDGYASEYFLRTSVHEITMCIRHSKTKAAAGKPSNDRHNVELTQTIFATPTTVERKRKVYVVIEQTPDDTAILLGQALAIWLEQPAWANALGLMQWQS